MHNDGSEMEDGQMDNQSLISEDEDDIGEEYREEENHRVRSILEVRFPPG